MKKVSNFKYYLKGEKAVLDLNFYLSDLFKSIRINKLFSIDNYIRCINLIDISNYSRDKNQRYTFGDSMESFWINIFKLAIEKSNNLDLKKNIIIVGKTYMKKYTHAKDLAFGDIFIINKVKKTILLIDLKCIEPNKILDIINNEGRELDPNNFASISFSSAFAFTCPYANRPLNVKCDVNFSMDEFIARRDTVSINNDISEFLEEFKDFEIYKGYFITSETGDFRFIEALTLYEFLFEQRHYWGLFRAAHRGDDYFVLYQTGKGGILLLSNFSKSIKGLQDYTDRVIIY